jgi:esterase/lipase
MFRYGWWALGWDHEACRITDWYDLDLAKQMKITDEELRNITCPVLALIGENEGKVMVEQSQKFYDTVSSEIKKQYMFTLEKDGTADHCQIDNRSKGNQVMFDWLDDLFLINKETQKPVVDILENHLV